MPNRQLSRQSVPASVQIRPPTVRVKAPKIVIPEIKIPPIQIPPVNFGPISNELSKLNGAVRSLQNVVEDQRAMINKLENTIANIKLIVPPRPRTFEVDIDDGNGGTRRMRVRASK